MKRDSELHVEETFFEEGGAVPGHPFTLPPASRSAFVFVALAAFSLAAIAFGKVSFLNFAKGTFYRARAAANVTREVSLPSNRAVILDRFGKVLAGNESSASVYVNLSALLALYPAERLNLLQRIADILSDRAEDFVQAVGEADVLQNNWFPIARNITPEEAIALKGLNAPSIQIVDDYQRIYPDGEAFAHIVGYTGIGEGNEIEGKAGLELAYDREFRGEDGTFVLFEDASGRVIGERIGREPQPRPPFTTTIDGDFQEYLYRRLRDGLVALGRDSGVAIAIDPETGEVLALVGAPSFDPNIFVDRTRSGERARVLNDQTKPLFNRAVSGSYSPGSTIKPLVALAALHEGVVEPETRIFSSGALEIPNPYQPDKPSVFLDWKAHGWVDLPGALARSSNIYFYLVGGGVPPGVPAGSLVQGSLTRKGLGIEALEKYWKRFGFGAPTGIDLPYEGESFLPNPVEKEERTHEPWRLGDNYNVAIGQGDLSVTPLQLLSFFASIGNGGTIYRPFLEKGSVPIATADYSVWKDELRVIRQGLEEAVTAPYGSSYTLHDLPMTVAGKTGTPQVAGKTRVNAFFVGYAPAEHPKIAILIGIENAREGSLNALPIAKDALRWYYEHRMKIKNEK